MKIDDYILDDDTIEILSSPNGEFYRLMINGDAEILDKAQRLYILLGDMFENELERLHLTEDLFEVVRDNPKPKNIYRPFLKKLHSMGLYFSNERK